MNNNTDHNQLTEKLINHKLVINDQKDDQKDDQEDEKEIDDTDEISNDRETRTVFESGEYSDDETETETLERESNENDGSENDDTKTEEVDKEKEKGIVHSIEYSNSELSVAVTFQLKTISSLINGSSNKIYTGTTKFKSLVF